MNSFRLAGLDLDGTVLTRDKTMTRRTREAIERAIARGISVAVVTGRPLGGLPAEVRAIPGIRYAITSNGAVTTDLETGERLRTACVPRADAEELIRVPIGRGMLYSVFAQDYGYCDRETFARLLAALEGRPVVPYMRQSRRVLNTPGEILEKVPAMPEGVENIWMAAGSERDRDMLAREIMEARPHLRIVLTGSVDVEIGGPGADKGLAVRDLAERLGIPREEIFAVGDDGNDIGLLSAAGLAVAMGNAGEEVRRVCACVTEDADHDGCALAMERYLGL